MRPAATEKNVLADFVMGKGKEEERRRTALTAPALFFIVDALASLPPCLAMAAGSRFFPVGTRS